MKLRMLFLTVCILHSLFTECSTPTITEEVILTGADQADEYLHLLKDKRVGLVANHTAIKGDLHLLDFLVDRQIDVVKVFAPEHGFRGEGGIGEKVRDEYVDEKTGVNIISIWGKNNKPSQEQLKGIDMLVFDIQDVGCRFYTYLSTLFLVMEASAENGVPLLVLDRPNPNGDYVAGPILEPAFKSFVGIVPVPIVHGCTLGEMARMINGEKWTNAPVECQLTVIKVKNYTHKTEYKLPVPPSPNLPNHQSVRLYPSVCLFEATTLSYGRGTPFPFQVIGDTLPVPGSFQWIPKDLPGISINPAHEGKTCYGLDLRHIDPVPPFTLRYFIDFYRKYPSEKQFLHSERWLNQLAGTDKLLKGIREGKTGEELMSSWNGEITEYKRIRKKYLLYPDFE